MTVVARAILLPASPSAKLVVVGATTLVLLFIGIRNSWESVTYVASGPPQSHDQSRD